MFMFTPGDSLGGISKPYKRQKATDSLKFIMRHGKHGAGQRFVFQIKLSDVAWCPACYWGLGAPGATSGATSGARLMSLFAPMENCLSGLCIYTLQLRMVLHMHRSVTKQDRTCQAVKSFCVLFFHVVCNTVLYVYCKRIITYIFLHTYQCSRGFVQTSTVFNCSISGV